MKQGFSKIWIAIILLVLVAGGILAWQYLWLPKEEGGAPEGEVSTGETADWKIYSNKDYGFEIKYPKDWDYTILEIPNNPIIFTPQDIITKVKQSIANIESDKSFTLWLTVYDKTLFEGGILPYRGKSNEYIKVTSSDVDVDGIKGNYFISEYLKDKGGYKVGEKTVTVDLPIRDGYLSMNLFDYQYVNIFDKILSTFKFLQSEEIADWQTYRNKEYGLEVSYPPLTASLSEIRSQAGYSDGNTPPVIVMKTSLEQQSLLPTRSPEGRIEIYADNDPVGLDYCLESEADRTTVINGIEFKVFDESSAYAGGRIREDSYRALYKGRCYRIQSLTVWTGIDFYRGATTGEGASEGEIQEQLALVQNQVDFNHQILSTFRFVKK